MARHSDKKFKGIRPSDPSRRSFIERMVGTGVTAPALMTLTGTWLAADTAFAAAGKSSLLSGSGSASNSSISTSQISGSISGSASGSSSGPPGIAHSSADSTLRQDSPNTNEGANPLIRVGVRPRRRGLVQFDGDTVAAMRAEAVNGGTVYLTLQIAANGNNWSQDDDNFVDVHPLPIDFWVNEGNGKATGLPLDEMVRGSGAGVTWNAPNDTDNADTRKNVKKAQPRQWNGGSDLMGDATAPGVLHVNGLTGQVSWDVTADVIAGSNAWIVKVRNERAGEEQEEGFGHDDRQLGYDPDRGNVDYFSKEGAAESIGCVFPPQLQLVSFNNCGSGSSNQGSQSQSLIS